MVWVFLPLPLPLHGKNGVPGRKQDLLLFSHPLVIGGRDIPCLLHQLAHKLFALSKCGLCEGKTTFLEGLAQWLGDVEGILGGERPLVTVPLLETSLACYFPCLNHLWLTLAWVPLYLPFTMRPNYMLPGHWEI